MIKKGVVEDGTKCQECGKKLATHVLYRHELVCDSCKSGLDKYASEIKNTNNKQ